MSDTARDFDPASITRPEPALLTYYVIIAAFTLAGFPFVLLPLWFRYHTLAYAFDDEGVTMSWGFIFRREISLTYRRIQDIHVSRNIIQRHLGLASVAIQTASGTAGAEMTIEGVRDPEKLRDFLYATMRGAREEPAASAAAGRDTARDGAADEALSLLREIRDALRARDGRHESIRSAAPGGPRAGDAP